MDLDQRGYACPADADQQRRAVLRGEAIAAAMLADQPLRSEGDADPRAEAIARAAAIWRPLAPDSDSLAREGLAFLRTLLAEQPTHAVH